MKKKDVNIYEYMGVNYKNETKIKGKQFLELPQRGRNRLFVSFIYLFIIINIIIINIICIII